MMNNFIKHLSLIVTAKIAIKEPSKLVSQLTSQVTSRLSPILLTSLQLSLMLTLMLMTVPGFAEQAGNIDIIASTEKINETDIIKSYSSGQSANSSSKLSPEKMLQAIRQKIMLGDSDQALNKALNISRDDVITQKQQQARKQISASLFKKMAALPNVSTTSRSFSDGNFVIYQAYSQLIEDYDNDGYYQTFSVTFDADLITYSSYDEAVVYAELYLSENGGPWQHYYTTDNFVIYGESSDDEFEVYSTLVQGFSSNHYDVLIDLYEEGYPNIIASYSSDDSNSLYALPLESSDYDVEYIEYYEETHGHGGSYSLAALLILMLAVLLRKIIFVRENSPQSNNSFTKVN